LLSTPPNTTDVIVRAALNWSLHRKKVIRLKVEMAQASLPRSGIFFADDEIEKYHAATPGAITAFSGPHHEARWLKMG
jgi:hypothetical protein